MSDIAESSVSPPADCPPAPAKNWARHAGTSLAIMIAASLPVWWEYATTGSADRLTDTPMIPLGMNACFTVFIVLVLPFLIIAGSGAFWVTAGQDVSWRQRLLFMLIYLAVYGGIIVVFELPLAPPLTLLWFFVWGGWIASKCRVAELAPINELACGAFRVSAWLYAAGVGIAGMAGLWLDTEPPYEHGYLLTGKAWFWASGCILGMWLAARVPGTRDRLQRACLVLITAATVFLARDLAILRAYLWGELGRTIAAADPHRGRPSDMQLIQVNGRGVYLDSGPVSKAGFICFLNQNPEWQRSGLLGRQQANRLDNCTFSVYLRCVAPAFKYLPMRWMYASDVKLTPMTHITSDVANAYADWAGKRLPSSGELKAAGVPIFDQERVDSKASGAIVSDDPLVIAAERATFRCAKDAPPAPSTQPVETSVLNR